MTSRRATNRDARPQTVERLRTKIDGSRTGDKVAGFDPAAVPLGTDDEAGGASPVAGRLADAGQRSPTGNSPPYPPPVERAPPRQGAPVRWLIVIGILIAALVGMMFAL